MADPKGLRQLVEGNDCWITAPGLQAANILLAESGNFAEPLLRQPPFEPNPLNILGHQPAHIHALNEK